jgi:pseudaminic acid cytidylyltransferase
MRALAVIPARGGSKRIPRKNIRPFLGVPLLTRTVAILRQAAIFDRVVVSTDDDEIAAVARDAGAEVPFQRPPELANDFVATIPVIAHAVREMERLGARFDAICCVYPAAVLSLPADYREAERVLHESDTDYVFTATSFPFPIQRAVRRLADGGCEMFWPQHRETRSQDLEPAFHDAGQFYFGRRDAWLESLPLCSGRSRMLLLPRHRVQDVDTPEDWRHAEVLFEILNNLNNRTLPGQ